MKLKKKARGVLVGCMMVLMMSGCGGNQQKETAKTDAAQTTEKADTAQSTEKEIADNGGAGDGKFKESPKIHELVEKGQLPPIEERLPKEPAIVEVSEIGVYGGTYVGGAFGPSSGQVDIEMLRAQSLLTIEKDLQTFKPNIIKAYEVNDDFTTYTIHLREGMKWSNGDDFTTDDWMFWYEDILMNKDVNVAVDLEFTSNGKPMKYVQKDEYTLEIVFEESNPSFEASMARRSTNLIRSFFAPKKYLSQWHTKYNSDAAALAKEEGFESWVLCFSEHLDNSQGQKDCEAPDVYPWVLDRIDENGNKFFARNPFYYVVDQEGNQLPYIDEQEALIVQDKDVRSLKLISGEILAAGENPFPLKDYTMLKENEEKGDYKVHLFENTRGSDCAFAFNLTIKDENLRTIFTNKKFRQAMSIALDRKTINETLYFGKGTLRQATAAANTSFMKEEFETAYIEFDMEKANAMLDECGYKWNSANTVRLMPNGEEFNIILETTEEFAAVSEMACEQWNKVGIQVTLKQEERTYYRERGKDNQRSMVAFTLGNVGELGLRSQACAALRPGNAGDDLEFMPLYKDWWKNDGTKGEQPPEDIEQLHQDCLKFGTLSADDPQYSELGTSILQKVSDQCWLIGTVVSPRMAVVSNRLGNTPSEGTFADDYNFWKPYRGDCWYFKY